MIALGLGPSTYTVPATHPLLGVPQAQQTEQPDWGSVSSAEHSTRPRCQVTPPPSCSVHGASGRCFACREFTLSVRQSIIALLGEVLPAVLDDDEVLEMDGDDGCTTQ